jgi:hypothetical protein
MSPSAAPARRRKRAPRSPSLDRFVAEAIIGIDTLWGGDVMCPSGTGRFIADSWFSDAPLPAAYTHPAAAALRASGGVGAKTPDLAAVDAYLKGVDVAGAVSGLDAEARSLGGPRGAYLGNLALCLRVMWELALEVIGRGEPVPYARCVEASTGVPPARSEPAARRRRVAELLAEVGHPSSSPAELLAAVDAWRAARRVPSRSIPALAAAFIAEFDALTARNLVPHLADELRKVPRANIRFLPIKDAWFSGSMNYVGRARDKRGRPLYEATYEINASLEISVPEFQQLVSHEVVPGHVTTFAFLQDLFVRRKVGFECSLLTMNTRAAALFEGIANNAILIAHGVTDVGALPDADLQVGVHLALLQDDAKNQSSYLTWHEGRPQKEVADELRRDYLVSPERANKLSGAWGRHPLLGRMYLPCYRRGTEEVARLRREHPPARILPALYGCRGAVDVVTVTQALRAR